MATKVYVNWDPKAKWEADQKLKRKTDPLVAALKGKKTRHRIKGEKRKKI